MAFDAMAYPAADPLAQGGIFAIHRTVERCGGKFVVGAAIGRPCHHFGNNKLKLQIFIYLNRQ
jgi:hypothetical protein